MRRRERRSCPWEVRNGKEARRVLYGWMELKLLERRSLLVLLEVEREERGG